MSRAVYSVGDNQGLVWQVRRANLNTIFPLFQRHTSRRIPVLAKLSILVQLCFAAHAQAAVSFRKWAAAQNAGWPGLQYARRLGRDLSSTWSLPNPASMSSAHSRPGWP